MVLKLHKRRPSASKKTGHLSKDEIKAEIRRQKKVLREASRLFEANTYFLNLAKNSKKPIQGKSQEFIKRLEKDNEKLKLEVASGTAKLKMLSELLMVHLKHSH